MRSVWVQAQRVSMHFIPERTDFAQPNVIRNQFVKRFMRLRVVRVDLAEASLLLLGEPRRPGNRPTQIHCTTQLAKVKPPAKYLASRIWGICFVQTYTALDLTAKKPGKLSQHSASTSCRVLFTHYTWQQTRYDVLGSILYIAQCEREIPNSQWRVFQIRTDNVRFGHGNTVGKGISVC